MTTPDPRPLRILVIRYRFIGDTVLAIPFLRNLREAFPHAKIDVLAEPVSGDTLALCPYKDELLFYAPRLKGEKKRTSKFPTGLFGAAKFLRVSMTKILPTGFRLTSCGNSGRTEPCNLTRCWSPLKPCK